MFDQIKIVAPEISLGGNFTIDSNGRYYCTTKVYGYVKKKGLSISYEFLLGLLNSSLFWFYIQKTGYVLRGGYYTFKTNYVTPFPFPNYSNIDAEIVYSVENLVKEIIKHKKNGDAEMTCIQTELDKQICKLYDVDYNTVCSSLSKQLL